MAVQFENNIFHILTENTLYQMKVDDYGVLCHLWYGEKTGCCMDYLLDYPDVGFSGNLYEAGNHRSYSLNTLPLEYAASGVGDFRIEAVSVRHGDGSNALDLRYQGYKLLRGKYKIPGLPAVYAKEEEAETLEIYLKDSVSDIEVVLKYGILPKEDVITRSAVIINQGNSSVILKKAHSFSMDIPYGNWEWIHFYGRHMMERQAERMPLFHGIQESSSNRGISSHQQNPAILLCEKGCTETRGFCMGAALLYSGGFKTQIEMDQLNQVRLVLGINPETFSWKLEKGEAFYTPEAVLSCSAEGFSKLSQQFHSVIRKHVCRGKYKLSRRPVLINNWEATYFDFNEEKIFQIAKQAADLGIDMMVLDDGWFGKREDDCSGLGDWTVNEGKLRGGLRNLVKKINALGMRFGLWFEPEMVSEDSQLYRKHPDWVLRIPSRKPIRSRYQLVLDLSRGEIQDYLYDAVSKVIKENNIEYIKWDMNRNICDWYSEGLSEDRQEELPHRYVLGLYKLLERLTQDFPDVLFEGCSGGGGRFDAGMLYYCPQIWCSDDTDAHERTYIQYGTSFFYPISAVGSHVSAVPNHQTGRNISIEARGTVAMAGSFGFELDLNQLSESEKEQVKNQVASYKQYQELIHNGTYFRLSNPYESNLAVWEFVSENQEQILVQGIVYRAASNTLRSRICLYGLKEDAFYRIKGEENCYSGKALMAGGILLPKSTGDDMPIELYLEKVEK